VPKKTSKPAALPSALIISKDAEKELSPAQAEFNRLMKQLERARAKHLREQSKLDAMLVTSSRDLMPLIEAFNQADLVILKVVVDALRNVKFSKKRRELLQDLAYHKAGSLLRDPAGLNDDDISELEAIAKDLEPPDYEDEASDQDEEEFDEMVAMIKAIAGRAGVELDLSDLNLEMPPEDLERILQERLLDAMTGAKNAPKKPARKQTKAQMEKSKRIKEQEDAKKRDLKSLYKQLAKALHPDLETDPELKVHKETWMKRLTSAYADGDLRALLQIELEWLGEEATNLAAAGDEKLKVYCAVLKEQIREQKQRTDWLSGEPQYFTLRRFIHPFTGTMGSPERLSKELKAEVSQQNRTIAQLRGSDVEKKKTMERWADQHERSLRELPF